MSILLVISKNDIVAQKMFERVDLLYEFYLGAKAEERVSCVRIAFSKGDVCGCNFQKEIFIRNKLLENLHGQRW